MKNNTEKKNTGNIILTVSFLVFLFGMSLSSILMKDRDFSEVENRVLSDKPKFSMESLIDGTYGDGLEKYASDQLVFKDFLVKLKNQSLYITGRRRINNVYLSKENMFIQEYIEDSDLLTDNIEYIKNWCKDSGFGKEHIYIMAVPTASEIYNENLPIANMNGSEAKSIKKIEKSIDKYATFVDTIKVLRNNKDQYIYYNTDHHWTMLGAYYGYEALAEAMKNEPVQLKNMEKISSKEKFYGSLYSQAPLMNTKPDDVDLYDYKDTEYSVNQMNFATGEIIKESDSYIVDSKLDEKDKYTALFGGNYSYVKITNKTPDKEAKGKKILVFKDSYANSIIPYLISDYEQIDMIDLRFFDYISNNILEYTKSGDYQDVLFMYNISFLNSDKNFMGLME